MWHQDGLFLSAILYNIEIKLASPIYYKLAEAGKLKICQPLQVYNISMILAPYGLHMKWKFVKELLVIGVIHYEVVLWWKNNGRNLCNYRQVV